MLSRRLCSGLAQSQSLFSKHSSLSVHPNAAMFRAPKINSNITLGGLRFIRGSNAMYSSTQPVSNIWRPFLFTTGVCCTSLVVASVWRYENLMEEFKLRKAFGIDKIWNTRKVYVSEWERQIDEWKNRLKSLSDGEKIFAGILGANLLVCLAWAVPMLQPAMLRLFTVNIQHTGMLCWPLLFATFSHASILHLGLNMYALYSIVPGAVHNMGPEQFTAFYVASGVLAAFGSYLWLVASKNPISSLGASGAVLAVFGYMCTENPDLRLQIVFLPMINFDGDMGVKCIIGISLAGIIFKWGVIDHMAHLCGVLAGVAWSRWGNEMVWKQRKPIVDFWKEIRPTVLEK